MCIQAQAVYNTYRHKAQASTQPQYIIGTNVLNFWRENTKVLVLFLSIRCMMWGLEKCDWFMFQNQAPGLETKTRRLGDRQTPGPAGCSGSALCIFLYFPDIQLPVLWAWFALFLSCHQIHSSTHFFRSSYMYSHPVQDFFFWVKGIFLARHMYHTGKCELQMLNLFFRVWSDIFFSGKGICKS